MMILVVTLVTTSSSLLLLLVSSSEKRKVAKGKIVVDERTFFTGERQTSLSLLVVKF